MEFYNLIGIRRVAPLLLVLLAAISSCHSGPAVAGTRQRHEYSDYTPFAQQLPTAAGGLVYLPEFNAFLVPAETLYEHQNQGTRDGESDAKKSTVQGRVPGVYQPVIKYPSDKRPRPIVNFIKYLGERWPASSQYYQPYRPPTYHDENETWERRLAESTRLVEDVSSAVDDIVLVGDAAAAAPHRLTLRPVAKAVAGPRGVAVASPIAQAVLRRTDHLDYDPDAVAVAGPGGQAYSHPELVLSYIDDHPTEAETHSTTVTSTQGNDESTTESSLTTSPPSKQSRQRYKN